MSDAHWHLMLSHLPVLGVPFGAALLAIGLARRNLTLQRSALVVLILAGMAAGVAYLTGEPAEHALEGLAGRSEALIEAHEEAALAALLGTGVLAFMSAASLWRLRRLPFGPASGATVLTLAVGVAVTLAWVANLGGRISHPEIRSDGPTVEAALTDDWPDDD